MMDAKLASAGDDIKIWDCNGYTLVKQYNPHSHNVSSLAWSHDNATLASASSIGDKVVLNYTGASNLTREITEQEGRTCIAYNSTSRYIAGGGGDGNIHVWDLKTTPHKLKKSYKDHKGPVTSVQFNWNDTVIASGSETGEIILYNVVTGLGFSPLATPKIQAVRQLCYSHFKKSLLASVSDDGAVNLWDTNAKRLIHSFEGQHKAPATSLALSPLNEMLLMSVGLDKRIVCYDVQNRTAVRTMVAESPLTSADLLHDGATLAVGSTRGKIYIYDLRSGAAPVHTVTAHKSSVQSLKFQYASRNSKSQVGGKPSSKTSAMINSTAKKTQSSTPAASSSSSSGHTSTAAYLQSRGYNPDLLSTGADHLNGEYSQENRSKSTSDMGNEYSQGMSDRSNPPLGGSQGRLDFERARAQLEDNCSSHREAEEDVFSPIRERKHKKSKKESKSRRTHSKKQADATPLVSRDRGDGMHADVRGHDSGAGRSSIFSTNNRSDNYGEGLFSPLADGSSHLSSRTLPSGLESTGPSPLLANRYMSGAYEQERRGYELDGLANHVDDLDIHQDSASHSSSANHSRGSSSTSLRGDSADVPVQNSRTPSSRHNGRLQGAPYELPVRDMPDCEPEVPVSSSRTSRDLPHLPTSSFPEDSQSLSTESLHRHNHHHHHSRHHHQHSPSSQAKHNHSLPTPPDAGPSTEEDYDPGAHHAEPRGHYGVGAEAAAQAPTPSFQTQFIRNMIDDALDEFKEEVRKDVLNLHMEMLKQFQLQQMEIKSLLHQYSVNNELLDEVERLREENKRLQKKF